MAKQAEFPSIFARLKGIMEPFAPGMVLEADTPENYVLNAPSSVKYPRGLFFGAVQIKKNYVSYHLMPVYVFPDLLAQAPEQLRKRMQGKSCFNFTKLDDDLAAELAALTAAGYQRYAQEQLL